MFSCIICMLPPVVQHARCASNMLNYSLQSADDTTEQHCIISHCIMVCSVLSIAAGFTRGRLVLLATDYNPFHQRAFSFVSPPCWYCS
jgi:hypothetical protein